MRIEDDKPVRADHAHDCHGSEKIEAEDAIGRRPPGDGMESDRHEFAMNGPPISCGDLPARFASCARPRE